MKQSKAQSEPSAYRVTRNKGRNRILNAALSLFADRPPESVTTREIAIKAGVSVPLIWHHFQSKDHLKECVDQHVVSEAKRIWTKNLDKHAKHIVARNTPVDNEWAKELQTIAPHISRLVAEPSEKGLEVLQIFEGIAKTYTREFLKTNTLAKGCTKKEVEEIILILMLGPILINEPLVRATGKNLYDAKHVFRRKNLYGKLLTGGLLIPK